MALSKAFARQLASAARDIDCTVDHAKGKGRNATDVLTFTNPSDLAIASLHAVAEGAHPHDITANIAECDVRITRRNELQLS